MLQSLQRSLYRNVRQCLSLHSVLRDVQTCNVLSNLKRTASHSMPTSSFSSSTPPWHTWHATTILAVRKGKDVVVIGDGQVTSGGSIVVKPNARKVRRVGGGKVIAGFAGTTADAFTLMERLETHLEEYPGQLLRASVEMAKQWRTDRYLRHLEAMLIACDENVSLCISGNGDVIEPHDGLLAIGSGGNYALAAARALSDIEGLSALDIAKKSMKIASQMCVYTNDNFVIEQLEAKTDGPAQASSVGSKDAAPPSPLSASSSPPASTTASTSSTPKTD